MDQGNWIPISKVFAKHLPKDREYTKLEAAFSIQIDYDCKNTATVSGYASLWRWSRNKVTKFLKDMNVVIIYPENTKKRRNQKGHIAIHKQDIKGTYKGHIRCIENTYLQRQKDIKGTKEGHKKDISGLTTKEPKNLNPNPKPKKKTTGKFIKPNFQDVSEYCLLRKNNVDPNTFINFYESKGWMVGKNKMKDWKACIRTWENKNNQKGKINGKHTGFDQQDFKGTDMSTVGWANHDQG